MGGEEVSTTMQYAGLQIYCTKKKLRMEGAEYQRLFRVSTNGGSGGGVSILYYAGFSWKGFVVQGHTIRTLGKLGMI